MDEKEVEALRVAYNKEHPNEKPIPKGKDVWSQITFRLKEACKASTPECIVRNLIDKPAAPMSWKVNSEEWLSSDDIDQCQKAYMKLIPDYLYMGTVPIDFDTHSETGKCLVSALCSIDLRDVYKKGYRRVGIVFNTDVSTGPGEHWIAAFCDFRDELEYPQMTYFDSYAQKPEKEIQRLMNRWSNQIPRMKLRYNKTRHQYKNAQCGMYSLYFLHCSLFDIPMEDRVPDDVIAMMRPMFFKVS
jgi:hypothetical protein